MAIFFLWLFLLIIFMCCGPRRVGFLAGFKMKHPHDAEKFRTPIVVRFIMILSCLIVIAAAVTSTIFFGLKDMKDVANDGMQLVNVSYSFVDCHVTSFYISNSFRFSPGIHGSGARWKRECCDHVGKD